ncbi:MAG TPA: hypothetical protein VGG22_02450 [Candidatus Baltobacteraceae bacterium]|jgi:hypothetical protein
MHDAIRLETSGIPTAVLVTTVFLHEAKVQREALGMTAIEPVVVTHPLSTLSNEQLDERAAEALEQVVHAWGGK